MIKHIVGYTACRALGRSRPNGLLVSRHRLGPESISQGVAMRVAPGCRTAAGESVLHNTKGPLARAPWLVRHQYVTVDTKVDERRYDVNSIRTALTIIKLIESPLSALMLG